MKKRNLITGILGQSDSIADNFEKHIERGSTRLVLLC